MQDCVLFLGQRNDANELYQAMDVFVLPSLYEGLGMVLIEAQYAGLKCFCSEAVPKEAYISKLLTKITLSESPSNWAKKIIDEQNGFTRKDMTEELKDSGYDIKKEAKKLEDKYYELLNAKEWKFIQFKNYQKIKLYEKNKRKILWERKLD